MHLALSKFLFFLCLYKPGSPVNRQLILVSSEVNIEKSKSEGKSSTQRSVSIAVHMCVFMPATRRGSLQPAACSLLRRARRRLHRASSQ